MKLDKSAQMFLGLTAFFVYGLAPAVAQVGTDDCYDVPEYEGINAVPAMTMQIHPSSNGDTVVNDAEYPPGEGEKVVVGFWEHARDYEPKEGENPCAGEPVMKIAYPLKYGSRQCYGWKHWTPGEDLHENSAKNFSCDDGVFSYSQWTTMDCTASDRVGDEGTPKTASPAKCCRDNPPEIWSLILSGCGKEPPQIPAAPNADDCTSPLVMVQTGSDPACGEGGNVHAWPVGMAADDCHGWESIDDDGKPHDNSANNIFCGADGKLHFTQFAGTLTCEGGEAGNEKVIALNECEQDIPPTLYTKAIDLTCCTDPESPECESGNPSVSVEGSTIYLNGQPCIE